MVRDSRISEHIQEGRIIYVCQLLPPQVGRFVLPEPYWEQSPCSGENYGFRDCEEQLMRHLSLHLVLD